MPAARGKVSSSKWVPCHVQSLSAPESLLPARPAVPPNLAVGASVSPHGDGALGPRCWHGHPLIWGKTWGSAAEPGGWHPGWLRPGSVPPGTCWTWTPSPNLTQVGGGTKQGAQHGHSTAAQLCSSLCSGGPLRAGLREQRVEGGERSPSHRVPREAPSPMLGVLLPPVPMFLANPRPG